MGTKTTVTGGG